MGFGVAIPLHIAYNYLLYIGNIPLAYGIVGISG